MKKKLLTMFLVLMVAGVSLAGCRKDKTDKDTDKKTEETTETKSSKKTATEEEKEKTKTEIKEKEEDKLEAERGTVAEGVYKNEVFGVIIPIPENTTVYTDEQIVQMLGSDIPVLSEDKTYTAKAMEEHMAGVVYDAVIPLSDQASNISVIYENRDKSAMGTKTEEEYATENAAQLEAIEGYGYKSEGITKENLGGTEFTVLSMKTDYYYQKYYLHIVDNYLVEFIVTYTDETKAEAESIMSTILFDKTI